MVYNNTEPELFSDRLLKTRPEFLSAALYFQTGLTCVILVLNSISEQIAKNIL